MLRECGAICWRVLAWICWRVLAWIEVWGLYGSDDGVDGRRATVLLHRVGVVLGTRK